MTTTETGRKAETAAAAYLASHGFAILARNWRTRWCELDLVVRRDQVVYFVEVKYRSKSDWGGGLDYVTPVKLRHLQFAARFWQAVNRYDGDSAIMAVAVGGPDFKIERAVIID